MDIRLLGAVEAHTDGRVVGIGHARQRAVLAVLAAEAGTVLSTDTLADRVWGADDGSRHRDSLYNYISRLRRALPGVIARRGGGYVFDADPGIVDLHRFRALVSSASGGTRPEVAFEDALALWRGEAFAGLDAPWLSRLAVELETERHDAWLARNDALLAATPEPFDRGQDSARQRPEGERLVTLAAELERAARERPGDERLAAQAIVALHRIGRRSDAFARFEATRRLLREELGADPGARLREAHRLLLDDSAEPAAAPRPADVVPRQVPHLSGHFTGRRAELAALDALTSNDTSIVLLCGPGGIGKTWLAQRWARDNAARFADGQLYVDLHGFDPAQSPMTSEHALRVMLTALDVPESAIPSGLDAAAGLLRSLTTGRRLLVILDNVRDHRQVVPLLPGAGCATIVTSRLDLAGLMALHGARRVALPTLDEPDAHRALATQLGGERLAAEPEACAALIAHCAGLPLALGILAANASVRPDVPLSQLAADLRDRTTRLDELETGDLSASLRSVLATSLRTVSAPARAIFSSLGLAFTTTLSGDAAASLAASSPAATRRSLRELETAHLLNRDATGRYRLHDLTALYAAEVAAATIDDPQQTAARRRLVDHYLHASRSAARAYSSLTPPTMEPALTDTVVSNVETDEAADWFAAEYSNLIAAQKNAVALGLDGHVWRLAWTIGRFQWARARWPDAIEVWERAARAAERLDDPTAMTIIYNGLGLISATAGDLDRAAQAAAAAERTAARIADAPLHLSMLTTLASIADSRGDHAAALTHAERMVELAVSIGDPGWEARGYNAMGWCLSQMGDVESAQAHCERALSIRESHEVLRSLIDIAIRRGQYARAIEWGARATRTILSEGNLSSLAEVYDQIGDCHARMNDSRQARQRWNDAAELLREQGRHAELMSIQDKIAGLDLQATPPPG